jgi:S1-C subfamily serine protease
MADAPPAKQEVNLGLEMTNGKHGGVSVMKVDRFGSAGKAGVLVNDEILSWNGQSPKTEAEFLAIMTSLKVGETLRLRIVRNGAQMDLPVPLLAKRKKLSLDLEELDETLERKISPAN